MIKCPNCGAELKFDADAQSVTCKHCKSSFDPKELKTKVKKAEELDSKGTYTGKSYLCSQCGAELMTFDETAITFCSYCGSQAMIESKMITKNNPDLIIPFKKGKDEIIKAYKNTVSKSIFAPRYMKSDIVVSKFRGIYIPYCIYKVSYHGKSVNHGSKYSHRSGDYVYYNDYSISAKVDTDCDGVSYDLISNFYDKFSHSIPYNYKGAEKFNANYLAGFYADTSDVEDYIYESDAQTVVREELTDRMKKHKQFKKYGCTNPKVGARVSEKKIGMFPLYFLAIRNKKNDRINYAVVNGQTGKVAADLPIDFSKYILFSSLIAILIFLLINNALVIVPRGICWFSIIVSGISMLVSIYQTQKIANREHHLDDDGYMFAKQNGEDLNVKIQNKKKDFSTPILYFVLFFSVVISAILDPIFLIFLMFFIPVMIGTQKNKKKNNSVTNVKLNRKEKFKYAKKTILAAIVCTVALVCNFVDDTYYYGASIISFLLIIWSFYDLVKQHNLLVSSKLPQLEKRGGDENE